VRVCSIVLIPVAAEHTQGRASIQTTRAQFVAVAECFSFSLQFFKCLELILRSPYFVIMIHLDIRHGISIPS
jgi:hypothetical protein